MKVSFLVLLGLALAPATAGFIFDRGDAREELPVPARQLAYGESEQKEFGPLIEFVLTNLNSLIAFKGKTGGQLHKQESPNPAPRQNGDPKSTSFEAGSHLVSYVFRLSAAEAGMNADVDLFWVHFGRGKAAQAVQPVQDSKDGEAKKGPKKSTTDLSVELTNGIVSSKIKVAYSFGLKELIEDFIQHACFNFLMKVEQSVPNLYSLLSELDAFMSPEVFSLAFQPQQTGDRQAFDSVKAEKVARNLVLRPNTEEFKSELAPADEKVKKMIEKAREALGGAKDAEHLVYTVTPVHNAPLPADYANYIDAFHVILVRGGNRLMVLVQSSHYSDSVEVSVNSKTSIFETLSKLLTGVIYEKWDHFVHLDAPADAAPDPLAIAKKFLEKLKFAEGSEANQEVELYLVKDLGYGFTILAEASKTSDGDYEVKVSLQKKQEGKDVDTLMSQLSYFPTKSQFNVGLFIASFVEKTAEDQENAAYSMYLRAAVKSEGGEPAKPPGSRYSPPFLPDIPHKTAGGDKPGALLLFSPFVNQLAESISVKDCDDRLQLKKGFPETAAGMSVQAVLCWRTDKGSEARKVVGITLAPVALAA